MVCPPAQKYISISCHLPFLHFILSQWSGYRQPDRPIHPETFVLICQSCRLLSFTSQKPKLPAKLLFFIHFTSSIGSHVYSDTTWLSRSENKFLQKCKLLGKTQAPAGCSQITESVSWIRSTMVFLKKKVKSVSDIQPDKSHLWPWMFWMKLNVRFYNMIHLCWDNWNQIVTPLLPSERSCITDEHRA